MEGFSILLFFIAILDGVVTLSVEKSTYNKNMVTINHFQWPADAASLGRIPNVEWLSFTQSNMDIFPENFTDQFKKCIRVSFQSGYVKTIHINPKLTNIDLGFTSTENVIIKRGMFYQLEKFSCYETKLTRIPENISQLKNLKHLDLNNNFIQSVQLDLFNCLDNLNTLDLTLNEIKHIYNNGSVNLPSLTNLHLRGNQLLHFDVCSWNMPSLSFLEISYNNLTHFAIHHFRALKDVLLFGNPMNCAWKNSLLKDKSDIRITGVTFCDEQSEVVFGLDCPSTNDRLQQQNSTQIDDRSQAIDHSKQQNSNFEFRLAQVEETIYNNSQQFAEIKKRFKTIEELLENLSGRVIEQQNISNDIVEAFYRAEIERLSQSKKKSSSLRNKS